MAPSAARNLTLTEELERLEQSITLTLQEIDANFSRAHRIVTSSILPIVQQYAQHSDSVWTASKFWKDFFEASANISLTGYEEAAESSAGGDDTLRTLDDGDATGTTHEDDITGTTESSSALERPSSRFDDDQDDSLVLDSPTAIAKMTPRPQPAGDANAADSFADYSSPYEELKEDIQGTRTSDKRRAPATPNTRPSPFQSQPPTQTHTQTQTQTQTQTKTKTQPNPPNADPLLHRVLDKNYRIQATPRTARRSPLKRPAHQHAAPEPTRTLHPALDSSPFSPGVEAPQLRAEIFGPPPSARRARARARPAPGTPRAPRTPGVSVQEGAGRAGRASGFTPGGASARKTLFTGTPGRGGEGEADAEADAELGWTDSDSEGGDAYFGGLSPPKTVALNFPSSRVVQTPAREASRRMVEDLVRTAGGGSVTDEMSGEYRVERPVEREWELDLTLNDEDSPSVVRASQPDGGVDDSF